MSLKILLAFSFYLIAIKSHSQDVIGNWKLANWNNKLPDLEIRSDSTFLIRIDTSEHIVRFQDQNILNNEYTGIWTRPDINHLTLWVDSKSKFFLPYKIERLTKDEMQLRMTFIDDTDELGTIKYNRL